MTGDQWLTLTVAAIAAIAALTGAIIAAVSAGRRQRRDLRHARQLADVAELRAVLDGAAQVLVRAERSMKTAYMLWTAEGISDDARDAVRAASDAMLDCTQRIRIRIGAGEVHSAYNDAVRAHAVCQIILFERSPSSADRIAHAAATQRFDAARDQFFESAYRTVQSQVES